MKPLHIEICDVTLRDGEQTPGVSFSCQEKVEIATMLDTIGIEVIEAGFPAVSANEAQCVKTIANLGLDARICGFSRAREGDIQTAIDCGVDMVSIFIPTSELHVRVKFKKSREQVLEDSLIDDRLCPRSWGSGPVCCRGCIPYRSPLPQESVPQCSGARCRSPEFCRYRGLSHSLRDADGS